MRYNNVLSIIFFIVLLQLPFTANAVIEVTSVTPIANNISCDGAVNITAIGTAGPFTFEWTGPNGFMASTEDLNGLCNPGVYVVKVIFADGSCYMSLSATVVKCNLAFQPIQVVKPECAGIGNGSIQITPSLGGTAPFTYFWNNGATTQNLTSLSSGQYCLTITDVYGCKSKSECYTISTYDPLNTIGIDAYPTSPNCNGGLGAINITFPQPGYYSSPFVYLWSTGETNPFNINVSTSNYYSVTVTDGCNNTATAGVLYTIVRPLGVELSVTNFCSLPTDVISSSGNGGGIPYNYSWSNAQTTANIHIVSPGTYTVTVSSTLGCTATQSITLPVNQKLLIEGTINPPSFGICQNGYINLSIGGGQSPYYFSWYGPNGYNSNLQNISGLGVGTYCVTVTDENECTTTRCFNLVQNTTIGIGNISNVSSCSTNNPECNGSASSCNGTINLLKFGTAPLTYLWSNGSTNMNISNLCQGQYTVTITGANGCTQTLSAGICCCYPSAPFNYPSCLLPCYLPANQPPPTIGLTISNIIAPQTSTSKDGFININISSGFGNNVYSWSGPNGYASTNQNISFIGQGTYCVTVTNGCSSANTCVQISPCSTMNLQMVSKTNNCDNFTIGQIDVSVSGGNLPYSFNWSNGRTTEDVANLVGGTYTVTVTDRGNCSKTLSATILQTPPIISTNTTQCTETRRCGTVVKVISGYPVPGGYTDCNSFSQYCSLNGLPMPGMGQDQLASIFFPEDCLLACSGGQDLQQGQHVEHQFVAADPNEGCQYSNGCVFTNISINGTFYESYFLPSGDPLIISAPELLYYTMVCLEDIYHCRAMLSCSTGEGDPVVFQSDCIYSGEVCGTFSSDNTHQLRTKTPSNLDDYIEEIKNIYGFSEIGVPIDVFPEMSLVEYEKSLLKNKSYSALPYSMIKEKHNKKSKIEIYPNPFNEFCKIKLTNPLEIVEYKITNMLGSEILFQKTSKGYAFSEIIIDTKNIPSGLYQLTCKSSNGEAFFKKILKFSNK